MSAETTRGTEPLYELVFEGPVDESLKTLQRIRGVFVADLEFPVADVQKFLTEAPITIRASASEDELKKPLGKLKAAGAKVLIVKRGGAGKTSTPTKSAQPSSSGEEFTFEFDLDEASPEEADLAHEEPAEPKVYALDLDESSTQLSEVEALLNESPGEESENQESVENDSPGAGTLSLLNDDELEVFHKERGGVSPPPESDSDAIKNAPSEEDLEGFLDALDLAPAEEVPPPKEAPSSSYELAPLSLEESAQDTQSGSQNSASVPSSPPSDTNLASKPAVSSPARASHPVIAAPPQPTNLVVEEPPVPAAAPAESPPQPIAPTPQPIATTAPPASPRAPQPLQSKAPDRSAPADIDVTESVGRDVVADELLVSPVSPPIRRKKSKLPFDILIPILVGCVVLGAANWLYFGPRLREEARSKLTSKVVAPDNGSTKASASVSSEAPIKKYSGEESTPERTTIASVEFVGEAPSELSLTVTTPQPRARTKEEIVQGVFPPPWLRRLEAENIRLALSSPDQATYEAKAPFLAYLEYKGNPLRITGILAIRVKRAAEDAWEVWFEAHSTGYTAPEGTQLSVTVVEDGRPVLYLQGISTVKPLTLANNAVAASN